MNHLPSTAAHTLAVSLTKGECDEFRKTFDWLSRLVRQSEALPKTLLHLMKLNAKTLTEILELEKKADAGDRDASRELQAAVDQADRQRRSIAMKKIEIDRLVEELGHACTVARDEIRAAHRPLLAAHRKQLAELLAPFCPGAGVRMGVVDSCESVLELQSFGRHLSASPRKFSSLEEAAGAAAAHVQTIERMLNGEPTIEFTPDGCTKPAYCR